MIKLPAIGVGVTVLTNLSTSGVIANVLGWEYLDADKLRANLGEYRGILQNLQRDFGVTKNDLQAVYVKLSAARDISLRKVEVVKAADALTLRKSEAQVAIEAKGPAVETGRKQLDEIATAVRVQRDFKAQCEADQAKPLFRCPNGSTFRDCGHPEMEESLRNRNAAIENARRAEAKIGELQQQHDTLFRSTTDAEREFTVAVANREHAAQRLAALPRQMDEYATGRRAEAFRLQTAAEEGKRRWLESRRMERVRDQLSEQSMNRESLILLLKSVATGGTAPLLAPPTDRPASRAGRACRRPLPSCGPPSDPYRTPDPKR